MRIMVVAIALLVVGVLALAWQLESEIAARHLLLQQIGNLRAELTDKSKRDALEFSDGMCSRSNYDLDCIDAMQFRISLDPSRAVGFPRTHRSRCWVSHPVG